MVLSTESTDLALDCHSQSIIDKGHPLELLIIKHFHKTNLHCGHEQILSSMRQWLWIPSCQGIINKVLKQCYYYIHRTAKPQESFMYNIPSNQLAVHQKPLSNSAVDYFGPILIKSSKCTRLNPASAKRCRVLFPCLKTCAVHLELTYMSTDAFSTTALRRFISRRGFVKVLRSDNGSNFIGAEKKLKEPLKQLNHDKIIDVMSRQNIEWKFNPPISPWMGGVWESLVKLVKWALRVITWDRAFTKIH